MIYYHDRGTCLSIEDKQESDWLSRVKPNESSWDSDENASKRHRHVYILGLFVSFSFAFNVTSDYEALHLSFCACCFFFKATFSY